MSFEGTLITAIILTTLLFELILNITAEYLNIAKITPNLPDEFNDYYDQERYEKSQEYLRVCTKFGFITTMTDLLFFLCFWFLKGFDVVDTVVRNLGQGPVVTGLAYIGTLLILKGIISLPFSIYSTFVIEERFGFNKTTPLLFIKDLVKSIVISAILGSIIIGAILAFLESAGEWAWIICWGVSTIFILAVQYIVPTWIMPLFNKFTPLEEGELKHAILNYADNVGFPVSNIFVMDGSKRSTKANAFFTGFGKNRRIALFDTLIENYSTEELLAIIAHEIGHYKKKHIQKRMITGILQMGVIFFLISVFISYQGLFDAFFMTETSIYAGLIFFSMLFSPIDMIISVIMQFLSRKDEYEADRFAVKTTGLGTPMKSALKKLSVQNLSNLNPHPFYVFLNYSHPPIMNRLKAISESV
ncbi:Endopeptidase family protein [Desulfamplus magnetovallimortis]|uniref:Endopeptidase family protein n=1 Tax=Desulfamplus magnetovallimortis TaxID=1246637 RepID=A0A1W1H5Z5_9BACT|nr:M48 family metallopeptidase [Desulfamplus magnetovallimortis]SLM27899.1 Endopeptidase family protein [Desulfamplus magnetovallimortis]